MLTTKFIIDQTTNCWLFTGGKDNKGYGNVKVNKKVYKAHRFFYVWLRGQLKSELELHHKCENKACVNPQHLQPITKLNHNLLSDNICSRNRMKTHCKNGHLLSGDNVYRKPRGGRECLICKRIRRLSN